MGVGSASTVLETASAADKAELIRVCRASFPGSLRWTSPRSFAERWWSSTLASPAAETFKAAGSAGIAGFCVLVTDRDSWNRDAPQRRRSRSDKLAALLQHPLKSLGKALERGPASGPVREDPTPASWIELIAVAPQSARQGIGQLLVREAEARAVRAGTQRLGLCVATSNTSARKFYDAQGFEHIGTSSAGEVYQKRLAEAASGS